MKRFSQLLVLMSLLFFSSTCMSAELDFFSESPTVQPYIHSAYGYAFFPKVRQGGVIVGGSYGKGEVYAMGKMVGEAVIIKTSIGMQAGGASYSELIFFENKHAFDEFVAGRMDYSFTVSAVSVGAGAAITTGSKGDLATASAGSETGRQVVNGYQKGLRVFVHITGGFTAGATVTNQKVKFFPTPE